MNYPFKKIIRDISNYRYILKTIKKSKQTVEWRKFNLRADWIGRLYTVVNLPPEVTLSPDSPEEIRPAYVLEQTKPLNEYLTKMNLHEVIIPSLEPIGETDSYLVVYSPYFQKLSISWFVYRIIFLLILLWTQHKFGIFGFVKKALISTCEFIF